MSTYYYGSGISYVQYLQAKSFVADVTSGQQRAAKAINLTVSRQTRDIIASQEALARENIQCMQAGFDRLRTSTEEGFEALTWGIEDVSRGISELNATFQWGFSEMLSQLGRLNSAVSELVKLAKTPVQTLANNHFEIARDAYRKQLLSEALEELDKAISTYKLEWRYYTLAGTIRLGSVSGGFEHVDLARAEELFSLAARYARSDSPEDAARACLAAGWAAYCQGNMGKALTHSEECLALRPELPEGLFQTSKVYAALGEIENALPLLEKAIVLDKRYALKAAGDGDFQRHDAELRSFLEELRQRKFREVSEPVQRTLEKYNFWLSRVEAGRSHPLVSRARALTRTAPPLWDLLAEIAELQGFPAALDRLASPVRFAVRNEVSGVEYQVEETYLEEPTGGFFRRLGGPKERTRLVTHRGSTESVCFHDATGGVAAKVDFSFIPASRFRLRRYRSDGRPATQSVRITRPYLISSTLVTNSQYSCAMEVPSSGAPNGPMVGVSWYDVAAFCNALSRGVGLEEAFIITPRGTKWKGLECSGYRLPTEAEWQYACIGQAEPASGGMYWNEDQIDEIAWVKENSGGVIHSVGEKRPNQWGIYDPVGNVAVWVHDWFFTEPALLPEDDPIVPNESQSFLVGGAYGGSNLTTASYYVTAATVTAKGKAVRGGSYADADSYVRAGAPARRQDPSHGLPTIGFRVARTAIRS